MSRHFKHFSPLLIACILTVILSAGFITDGTVMFRPGSFGTGMLHPGIAAAQAEWDTPRFTNAGETMWNSETYITGREVNIRSGPDTSSESLGFFRFGEPVRILEDLGDWYKVEFRYSSMTAYVHKNFVGSWSTVKEKQIPSSFGMSIIDKLYDCVNASAPFDTNGLKGLEREKKLKEIDHYQDVIDKDLALIESSKDLSRQTIDDMVKAVNLINDMFACQRRFVTEPDQAANMRDEAYPDLHEAFLRLYETMEKYR